MKLSRLFLSLSAALALLTSASLAAPHTYQVTGPIVEMSDASISVMKGKEKWEIMRGPETKITGDLKVGGKVTIEYYMTGTTATVKPDKK